MLHIGECIDEGGRKMCSREKGNEKVEIQMCVCELRSVLQIRGKSIQYRVPIGFFLGIMLVAMRASSGWREH